MNAKSHARILKAMIAIGVIAAILLVGLIYINKTEDTILKTFYRNAMNGNE
jgi:hypothetical protein